MINCKDLFGTFRRNLLFCLGSRLLAQICTYVGHSPSRSLSFFFSSRNCILKHLPRFPGYSRDTDPFPFQPYGIASCVFCFCFCFFSLSLSLLGRRIQSMSDFRTWWKWHQSNRSQRGWGEQLGADYVVSIPGLSTTSFILLLLHLLWNLGLPGGSPTCCPVLWGHLNALS